METFLNKKKKNLFKLVKCVVPAKEDGYARSYRQRRMLQKRDFISLLESRFAGQIRC